MVTCTSIVRHGHTHLVATGTGPDKHTALLAAIAATDIGYRPGAANTYSAARLLARWERGDRPSPQPESRYTPSGYLTEGYANLSVSVAGDPVISTGWVDYGFVESED